LGPPPDSKFYEAASKAARAAADSRCHEDDVDKVREQYR
jgi:hypothetical protein